MSNGLSIQETVVLATASLVHVWKYTKEEWPTLSGTGEGKDAQWNVLGGTLRTSKPGDAQE